MQLDVPWLREADTMAFVDAMTRNGFAVYFVGGCVRNALTGQDTVDIDVATDASPRDVLSLAADAGFRTVPLGIDYGTVCVLTGRRVFEVTTFRKDIETFGRHARVGLAKDVAEDAQRRDFTMNALYLAPDGRLLDPLGEGVRDAKARRVRFVGDADTRIREDALRILRFFRFNAQLGVRRDRMDKAGLTAVAKAVSSVSILSAERIGKEFLTTLAACHPYDSLDAMAETGLLETILPACNPVHLRALGKVETQRSGERDSCKGENLAMRRLAALGGDRVVQRLRLSRKQDRLRKRIREAAHSSKAPSRLGYELGLGDAIEALLVRAAVSGCPYRITEEEQIRLGSEASFPVAPQDLMPAIEGKALGHRLKSLEEAWIKSEFSLTRDELLSLPSAHV